MLHVRTLAFVRPRVQLDRLYHYFDERFAVTAALPKDQVHAILLRCARSGEYASQGIQLLVHDARIDQTVRDRALRLAAASGNDETVRVLLDSSTNGAFRSALRLSALCGHVNIITCLLGHPRAEFADLASARKEALRFARDQKHAAVVDALMADDRSART